MADRRQVVIVGASLAGLRAAEALRELGHTGRLVMLGEEPHPPYDRPPLSKEVLKGEWAPERASLLSDELRDKLDLELRLGQRATALDTANRRVELEDGQRLAYDGLVIATGARPRRLPDTPDLAGIHTLRGLDDCLALRDALAEAPRVAVVGAGFIGGEVAASCRERGLEVTLIEALPVPLAPLVGEDVGSALAEVHRERGVDVRLGVGVEGFEGGERVTGVRLADGGRVEAELVVVGIGVSPNTQWLEGSGVELEDGVLCDEFCATSAPDVVAAGDVASWLNPLFGERMRVEHWSNATEMARAAAGRLLSGPEDAEPFDPVPFFWSDQYDVKIQSVGRCAGAEQSRVVLGSIDERKFVKLYGRKGRLVGAVGWKAARHILGWKRALAEGVSWDEALERASG